MLDQFKSNGCPAFYILLLSSAILKLKYVQRSTRRVVLPDYESYHTFLEVFLCMKKLRYSLPSLLAILIKRFLTGSVLFHVEDPLCTVALSGLFYVGLIKGSPVIYCLLSENLMNSHTCEKFFLCFYFILVIVFF
jgi:hypothetical protein